MQCYCRDTSYLCVCIYTGIVGASGVSTCTSEYFNGRLNSHNVKRMPNYIYAPCNNLAHKGLMRNITCILLAIATTWVLLYCRVTIYTAPHYEKFITPYGLTGPPWAHASRYAKYRAIDLSVGMTTTNAPCYIISAPITLYDQLHPSYHVRHVKVSEWRTKPTAGSVVAMDSGSNPMRYFNDGYRWQVRMSLQNNTDQEIRTQFTLCFWFCFVVVCYEVWFVMGWL